MAFPLLSFVLVYRCRTAVLLFLVDGFPTTNNRTDVQAAAISRTGVLLFMTDAFPGINNRTPVQRNQKIFSNVSSVVCTELVFQCKQ